MARFAKTEWELAALGIAALLLLAYLGMWALGFGEREPLISSVERPRPTNALINPGSAFAFLNPDAMVRLKEATPFFFLPTWSANMAVKPPPTPTPVVTPPEPVPPLVVNPVVGTVTPPPRHRPKKILQYCGCLTTPTGVKLALLRDVQRGRTFFLKSNDTLSQAHAELDEFSIDAFTPDALQLKGPAGQVEEIPFSSKRTFELK